ncbi:F0F1 ATP synthase subunit alpha, partial [Vibrio sp. 10N.222.55.E8]
TSLAQYRELAAFAQFSSDLDETTRKQLDHGERVTELMKQKQYSPMSVAEQATVIYAVEKGYLADVELSKIARFEEELIAYAKSQSPELFDKINAKGDYNDEIDAALGELLTNFVALKAW